MASRGGGVVQDQKLNIHFHETSFGLKRNVSEFPRKGVIGGRTPLGDLSNSLNQASKKQNSTIFSFTNEGIDGSQIGTKKKRSFKAPGKVESTGRKPLSDISDSGRLSLKEGSRKNFNAIAEEEFLHNHQECIKAQSRAMNLNQFLQIIGLNNDVIKRQANPFPVKDDQTPTSQLEVEEMTKKEVMEEEEFWNIDKLWSRKLDSSPPGRIPESPKHYMQKECNFQLLNSP